MQADTYGGEVMEPEPILLKYFFSSEPIPVNPLGFGDAPFVYASRLWYEPIEDEI